MLHSLFIVQLAALLVSYCVAQSSTTFNTTVTVGPQYTATQTGVVPDLVVQTAPQLVFGSSDGSYGQGGAQIKSVSHATIKQRSRTSATTGITITTCRSLLDSDFFLHLLCAVFPSPS